MDAPNISDILNRPADQIDRPAPLPKGSYIMQVQGLPSYGKSSKKQTPFAEFVLKPLQALEDVSEDELQEWATKADGSAKSLQDGQIKATFYLTEDSAFRAVDFCKHCGIDIVDEEMTLQQGFERLQGCQVGVHVKHTPFQSGDGVRAEIDRTFVID